MNTYGRIAENVARVLRRKNIILSESMVGRLAGLPNSVKHDLGLQFEKMEVVGSVAGGKVEAVCTPTGYVKRLRLHTDMRSIHKVDRRRLILAACYQARRKGLVLMKEAEEQAYLQCLVATNAALRPFDHPADVVLRSVEPENTVHPRLYQQVNSAGRKYLVKASENAQVEARATWAQQLGMSPKEFQEEMDEVEREHRRRLGGGVWRLPEDSQSRTTLPETDPV